METNASKMHEIRVKAEDEIERVLLEHHASKGDTLDRDSLRCNMDLAIAATIVTNKIKARGSPEPEIWYSAPMWQRHTPCISAACRHVDLPWWRTSAPSRLCGSTPVAERSQAQRH